MFNWFPEAKDKQPIGHVKKNIYPVGNRTLGQPKTTFYPVQGPQVLDSDGVL
jgi:hypothetical protein